MPYSLENISEIHAASTFYSDDSSSRFLPNAGKFLLVHVAYLRKTKANLHLNQTMPCHSLIYRAFHNVIRDYKDL